MWTFYSYNLTLRDHFIFNGFEEVVENEIAEKHKQKPALIVKKDLINLDPGGLICTNVLPIKSELATVKPEHILLMLDQWNKTRIFSQTDSQKIIKVYYGDRYAAVMPESIYLKIGSWLALNKANGYIATMDIVEKLGESGHHILFQPEMKGDS
jgi:hypothetical protein